MKNEGKYCKKNVTKNYPQKPYIFLYKKKVKQIKIRDNTKLTRPVDMRKNTVHPLC